MKKILCFVVAVLLMASVACPAFAAGQEFVPSIGYKDYPAIVVGEDDIIGVIRDEEGNVIDYIHGDCLVVTPLAKVNESELIPEESRQKLLYVYQELSSGAMQLPAEKIREELKPSDLVIRELFDVSWLCEEHPLMVEPKGVVFELTFRTNIDKNAELHCMTYKNDQWGSIVNVQNNGDGTVTCTFEDLCPVAFIVEKDKLDPTGDNAFAELAPWAILMVACAAALVCVVVLNRKEQMR